jgi:glyoxalase family protein
MKESKMDPIKGLHHVTAVTRDAQMNVNFYRNVLGQRLVKKTVNFDSPDSYHFYFADEIGTAGTVLTFFAWPGMKRGIRGNGETAALAYHIPSGSIGFWQDYLKAKGILFHPVEQRFGMQVLPFDDPDGMRIELVVSEVAPTVDHWEMGPIPERHSLRGFHSVTLWLEEIEPTIDLLINQMGYQLAGQERNRYRFTGVFESLASTLDILHRRRQPEEPLDQAIFGAGSIHHIAFRVPDDEMQLEYQSALRAAGYGVTPVRDRSYFHSIYYREPGGVLFEIATEGPGFAIDEPVEALGESLKLPAWFESTRRAIEENLPPITLQPIEKVK